MSATIFLHPKLPQRIPMGDIVRRLERAGYALSNVRAKHHSYEARMVPIARLERRSGVDRVFEFSWRPH